jgi:hypothetical protein
VTRKLQFAPLLFLTLSLLGATPLALGHGGTSDYEEDVEAMYVAYYGRPGDPEGVEYWAEQLELAEGRLDVIIDAFGNSDEYNQRFAEFDNEQLVNNIYQQLFGRDADGGGLDFYVQRLESSRYTLASIALEVFNGRQNEDTAIVANRMVIAHAYTDHIEDHGLGYGDDEIAAARSLLDNVDASDDSVAAAALELEALFDLPDSSDCSRYAGSYERIQSIILDGYNCTNSACHDGSDSAGNLDLRADQSYQNLFRVEASANLTEPTQLVYPGEQALSFLFQKLAAATEATTLPEGGGQAMPFGGTPLSEDHLEAMRLWIRAGAPEFADVDKVATLLGCSVGTAAQTNKIEPPPAPPLGEGIQLVSGPWSVEANSENEVCFASYYDLSKTPGALPDWAKVPCTDGVYSDYDGECFAYNEQVLTQDPQSHHSLAYVYLGSSSPLDDVWGSWQCLNGPNAGAVCDPTRIGEPVSQGGADCGDELYVCGTAPQRSLGCIGWGPWDHRQRSVQVSGAQSPVQTSSFSEGVYSVLPTRAVIIWNSHAFNLSAEETTVEQYNNISFAGTDQRTHYNQSIFDIKDVFIAQVPPYEERTYCSTYTLPRGTRLTELGSHAHKRGVLWQTWLPPQDPNCLASRDETQNCKPNAEPADYVSRIYNDPLTLKYDPPLQYDAVDVAARTLKFCLTYDNGKNFPELLKRNSLSVDRGTHCTDRAYCAGGVTPGNSCGSDDSLCGDGGVCDACFVSGGYTTEDEMFLLLGSYYLVPVD